MRMKRGKRALVSAAVSQFDFLIALIIHLKQYLQTVLETNLSFKFQVTQHGMKQKLFRNKNIDENYTELSVMEYEQSQVLGKKL